MERNKVLISQGAEARVYSLEYLGKDAILKERFAKKYRHPVLDAKITKRRVISESRIMTKASKCGILVPSLLFVSVQRSSIFMERVAGVSVKEFLYTCTPNDHEKLDNALQCIGRVLWRMHLEGIIHGDLTTSNMIYQADGEICLIDFGLASVSGMEEDKAVDLYVLERAIQSTHPQLIDAFAKILQAYSKQCPEKSDIIVKKLDEVRLRGRKKSMIG